MKEGFFMTQTASIFIGLSIALLAGLLMSRVAKKMKLPAVTAYLISGVLIGPFFLGKIGITGIGLTADQIEEFGLISDLALGFIAFAMGNEFRLSQLKKIGKQATVIGVFQAIFTTLLVDVVLILLHLIIPETLSLQAAIVLGSVATATAPAATLMVVKQYKAKGPVTDTLLPVVALDDAVGLILFAVSFGIAKTLVSGEMDLISIIVNPFVEIICSLLLGAIMGVVLTFLEKFFNSNTNRLNMTIAFVFITVALSMMKFSTLPQHSTASITSVRYSTARTQRFALPVSRSLAQQIRCSAPRFISFV